MAQTSFDLGWTNLPDCAKLVWVPTSIPGVSQPIMKYAPQELRAYAVVDSEKMRDDAIEAMKSAALAAVGAAGGIGAITANPAAAVATFKAAFLAALGALSTELVIQNVNIETRAQCGDYR